MESAHGGREMTMGEIVQAEGGIPVEPQPPHRAVELTIKIGGDTWEYVFQELHHLARHLEEHGPNCTSIAGGPDRNHIVEVHLHPEMTHDRYVEELTRYLDWVHTVKEQSRA